MRRQQEIVVDLTSHELRNPLNATWQTTEMVEQALERLRPLVPPEGVVALDEAQDAIESVSRSTVGGHENSLNSNGMHRSYSVLRIKLGLPTTCDISS